MIGVIHRADRGRLRVLGGDDLQDFVDTGKTTGGRHGKEQEDGCKEDYGCRKHQSFRSQVGRSSAELRRDLVSVCRVARSARVVGFRLVERCTVACDARSDSWKHFLHTLIT